MVYFGCLALSFEVSWFDAADGGLNESCVPTNNPEAPWPSPRQSIDCMTSPASLS